MKEPKIVKFGYARGPGFSPESFEDGVALLLPTGDVHITMWGGENSAYVSMSGTQNRLTHIVAVYTSCDSRIRVDEHSFQGDQYPAPLEAVQAKETAFVEAALRKVAGDVASSCDEASAETVYGILRQAFSDQIQ